MGHRRLVFAGAGTLVIVAAGLLLSPGPSAGQAPATEPYTGAPEGWMTSRTPWGDPDLQGIWDGGSIMPLERPEKFADREFLTAEKSRRSKPTPSRIPAATRASMMPSRISPAPITTCTPTGGTTTPAPGARRESSTRRTAGCRR